VTSFARLGISATMDELDAVLKAQFDSFFPTPAAGP